MFVVLISDISSPDLYFVVIVIIIFFSEHRQGIKYCSVPKNRKANDAYNCP